MRKKLVVEDGGVDFHFDKFNGDGRNLKMGRKVNVMVHAAIIAYAERFIHSHLPKLLV